MMTAESMNYLVPSRQDRPADDPIFALNAEASRRRNAGETIVNATLGTLMQDDGRLLVMETVARALIPGSRPVCTSSGPFFIVGCWFTHPSERHRCRC